MVEGRFTNRALILLSLLVAGTGSLPGCDAPEPAVKKDGIGSQPADIPAADTVTEARVTVFLSEEDCGCQFTVTEPGWVRGLVEELQAIEGSKLTIPAKPSAPVVQVKCELLGPSAKDQYRYDWIGDRFVNRPRNICGDAVRLRTWVASRLLSRLGNWPQPPVPAQGRELRVDRSVSRPGLPTAAELADATLIVKPSASDGPKVVLKMTAAAKIADLLARLGRIDFSQAGIHLENASIVAPDIELVLNEKTGRQQRYSFYWNNDSFIDGVTITMFEADVAGLREFVVRELVQRCAATALQLRSTVSTDDQRFVAALSLDGRLCVVSYPQIRELVLWNVDEQRILRQGLALGNVQHLAFLSGRRKLVCLREVHRPAQPSSAWELALIGVPGLNVSKRLGPPLQLSAFSSLRLSADGRFAAVITGSSVKVIEVETGKDRDLPWPKAPPVSKPGEPDKGPRVLAFSPETNILAVGAGDGSVMLFNVADAAMRSHYSVSEPVASLSFSPDGRLLAAGAGPNENSAADRPHGPSVKSVHF